MAGLLAHSVLGYKDVHCHGVFDVHCDCEKNILLRLYYLGIDWLSLNDYF